MRRQNQIAVQADIISNMADDENLGARDTADCFAIIWVAKDLSPRCQHEPIA